MILIAITLEAMVDGRSSRNRTPHNLCAKVLGNQGSRRDISYGITFLFAVPCLSLAANQGS